jgi:hypothetical protein
MAVQLERISDDFPTPRPLIGVKLFREPASVTEQLPR